MFLKLCKLHMVTFYSMWISSERTKCVLWLGLISLTIDHRRFLEITSVRLTSFHRFHFKIIKSGRPYLRVCMCIGIDLYLYHNLSLLLRSFLAVSECLLFIFMITFAHSRAKENHRRWRGIWRQNINRGQKVVIYWTGQESDYSSLTHSGYGKN